MPIGFDYTTPRPALTRPVFAAARAKPRARFGAAILVATLLAIMTFGVPARAQFFSNKDGYAADGTYRVQVELDPYLWLPATSGSVHYGVQRLNDISSGNFSTSVPSAAQLANSLHFSFMGDGVVRYGPYSAETDLQYVNASGGKTIVTGPLGRPYGATADVSYARVAPGLGYTVWAGQLGSIPASVDARVGFAYFAAWAKLNGLSNIGGGAGFSSNFVQPWLGGRFTLVPAPRWRIELGALVQGFGVDGGSWGGGGILAASYAVTDWFMVNLAFRVLNTDRTQGNADTVVGSRRALNITAYGPVLGVGFRF